jgi:hypothetical protein
MTIERLRPAQAEAAAVVRRSEDRERQVILKTDQRTILLELGLEGKFQAKSSGWDENRSFLEGDVLEVAVRKWPLGGEPRSGRSATGTALAHRGVCDIVTWDGNAVALRRNGHLAGNQPVRSRQAIVSLMNRPTASEAAVTADEDVGSRHASSVVAPQFDIGNRGMSGPVTEGRPG